MRVRESALRDLLRLIVWYPGRSVIGALPPTVAFTFMERMGDLHAVVRRPRAVARRIGAATVVDGDRAARRYVRNHYADRLHVFLYPRMVGAVALPPWLAVDGREHLDAARAAGRGTVIVHPHYAVPQLLPLALGILGFPCLQIGLPSDDGLSAIGRSVAFRRRVELEAMLPARILSADRFLRPAFAHLARGGIVLVTGDGAGRDRHLGRHLEVPLFGRRALLPVGPAKLALAAGATLLPAIVRRRRAGSYVARIDAPLRQAGGTARGDEAVADLTRAFASWFEHAIAEDPGLWHFWDRFEPGGMLVEDQAS